jgi:hypothetical protein
VQPKPRLGVKNYAPQNAPGLTLKTHANAPGITPVAEDAVVGCSVAAESAGATLGGSTRLDYAKTFFEVNPGLKGDVVVHHAIPQRAMKLYPDAITSSELHSLENLRGIPKEINTELHIKQINREWDQFYRQNATATQQQLLNKATEIDIKYGTRFNPPVGH